MSLINFDDFPLLNRRIDDLHITYLDSAATSLKPKAIMEAEHNFGKIYTSNIHRGHSLLSEEASFHYESARCIIAKFINADPETVIMTSNTSFSLGSIAVGLQLTPNDTILCSPNNHHSNLLPWLQQAKVAYVKGNPLSPLDPAEVTIAIKKYRPKVIALNWVSNVNGVICPIYEIIKIAREHGVISVIDAAQAAPHLLIDIEKINCDFLAFSGHKILGPTGTGVLWGRKSLLEKLKPLVLAGGTVDKVTLNSYTLKRLPHRLEPGTPNISGVIGLGAAIEYLQNIGFDKIFAHERKLLKAMNDVFENLRGVKILINKSTSSGIALASIVPISHTLHSDTLCQILSDSFKIMTRSGFHCAHPLFDSCGFKQGAVRISPYIYNTVEEIYRVGDVLDKILYRFVHS